MAHVTLRPRLPMAPGWFWDGSVRFAWSLPRTIKSHFALRPQLPPAPGWFRNGSVRFGWSLSMALPTNAALHRRLPMRLAHGIHLLRVAPEWLRVLRLRSLLISGVAITLGPVHGIADARVVPRRSGPKRLGCKHCRVALTTPSPHPGLRSCSSPPAGEVSFHTRHDFLHTRQAASCSRTLGWRCNLPMPRLRQRCLRRRQRACWGLRRGWRAVDRIGNVDGNTIRTNPIQLGGGEATQIPVVRSEHDRSAPQEDLVGVLLRRRLAQEHTVHVRLQQLLVLHDEAGA